MAVPGPAGPLDCGLSDPPPPPPDPPVLPAEAGPGLLYDAPPPPPVDVMVAKTEFDPSLPSGPELGPVTAAPPAPTVTV